MVEDLSAEEGIDWITALQAPQIAGLLDRVELPASLFDERDLADKGGNQNSVPCIPPPVAKEKARQCPLFPPCFPPLITSARIGEDLSAEEGIDWITVLQAPQIASLLDRVELPASLFDERDLADKGETKTVSLVSFLVSFPLPCILSLVSLYPRPCISPLPPLVSSAEFNLGNLSKMPMGVDGSGSEPWIRITCHFPPPGSEPSRGGGNIRESRDQTAQPPEPGGSGPAHSCAVGMRRPDPTGCSSSVVTPRVFHARLAGGIPSPVRHQLFRRKGFWPDCSGVVAGLNFMLDFFERTE